MSDIDRQIDEKLRSIAIETNLCDCPNCMVGYRKAHDLGGVGLEYFKTEYEKLTNGEFVVIPVSVEHANAMLLIAQAYLKEYA